MTSDFAALDPPVGGLEKAAIAPQDLLFRIARKLAEGGGSIDDGLVVAAGVNDDERAGHVDWAELDLGVGTTGEAAEEGEKIEARGGIDREAERGGDGDGERRGIGMWATSGRDGGLDEARGSIRVESGIGMARDDGRLVISRVGVWVRMLLLWVVL